MPVDIFFLNVGQGDCTLIRFTDDSGKITGAVLLDCGTIKPISRDWNVDGGAKCKPQVVQRLTEVVRTQLGAYNTLDYVILSHPDEDHHSELPAVLRNLTGVKVGRIWYGGDYGDYKAPVQELLDRHARSHPGDVDAVRRVEHLAIAERVELDATKTPTGPQVYLVEAQEFDSATGLVKLELPPESLIAKRKKGDLDRWARDQLKDEARVSAKEMTEKIRQKIAGMPAKTRKEIEDAAVLKVRKSRSEWANAHSIVVLVVGAQNLSGARHKVWLMADAIEWNEDIIIKRVPGGPDDVRFGGPSTAKWMKMGHHGSGGSTCTQWLAWMRPDALFISSGTKPFNGRIIPSADHLEKVIRDRAPWPSIVAPPHSYTYHRHAKSGAGGYLSKTDTQNIFTSLQHESRPAPGGTRTLRWFSGIDWHLRLDGKGSGTYQIEKLD
jgi:beta-lactamase superfamily II metal-dependent hydrolase